VPVTQQHQQNTRLPALVHVTPLGPLDPNTSQALLGLMMSETDTSPPWQQSY
jgi:hypothetical protein